MTKATKAFKNGHDSSVDSAVITSQEKNNFIASLFTSPPFIPTSLARTLLASAAAAICVAAATPAAQAQAINFTRYSNSTSGFSTSNNVNDVYASGNRIYAATDAGLSIYDGSSWTTTSTPTLGSAQIFSVYKSGDYIYAGGSSSLNWTTNNGQNWDKRTTRIGIGAPTGTTGTPLVRSVFGNGDNKIYAGHNAGFSFSSDHGQNWTYKTSISTTNGLLGNVVRGVYETGGVIYIATNSGIGISTDGGSTWSRKTMLTSQDVWGVHVDGNNIYAAVNNGGLQISTNGGDTWSQKTTSAATNTISANAVSSVYASGQNIYVGTNTGISISTNGGSTWTRYGIVNNTNSTLLSNAVTGIHASDGNLYVATTGTTTGGLYVASDPAAVPAPLPLLGAALPLSFCRRLRSRSKRLRHGASSRLA